MITTYNIQDILFDQDFLYIKLDDQVVKIPLAVASKKLKNATAAQRELYKISPSGYGIHWPLIDEDLSVEHLIKAAR